MEVEFEELISVYANRICKNNNNLYHSSMIPRGKLNNAISAYAQGILPQRVIALYDDTVFGSGKEGFLITKAGIYFSNMANYKPGAIKFASIRDVQNKDRDVEITLQDGSCIIVSTPLVLLGPFVKFIKAMNQANQEDEVDEVDHYVVVKDLSEDIKQAYFRIITHMALIDDGRVDDHELICLYELITSLELSRELRMKDHPLRATADQNISALLDTLEQALPSGAAQPVYLALVKDLTRLKLMFSEETKPIDGEGFVLRDSPYNGLIKYISDRGKIDNEDLKLIEIKCQTELSSSPVTEMLLNNHVTIATILEDIHELSYRLTQARDEETSQELVDQIIRCNLAATTLNQNTITLHKDRYR